jgi:TonB family protein
MRVLIMLAFGVVVYGQSAWQTEMACGDAALAPKTAKEAERHFRAAVTAASSPAEKAAALTKLGLVLEALSNKNPSSEFLTSRVEPLYCEAVELDSAATADRALALELYSMLLERTGRKDQAETAKAKAVPIRKSLIEAGDDLNPAACGQQIRQVGKDTSPPKLVSKIEPAYSDQARAMRLQGSVVLNVVVGEDGQIHRVRLVNGLGLGLDEQAAGAVRKWRFEPGIKDGAPVCIGAKIAVNFRLL